MKRLNINIIKGAVFFFSLFLITSCDKNFEEINSNPNGIDPNTASPRRVMATVQIYAFGEPRFITWRGNIIYSSQFAHHYVYNFADMAWFPGTAYTNNQGWTDNVWESSNIKVAGHLNALRELLDPEEDKEEVAVVKIISGWFYQKMTDMYGDIPYTDVAKPRTEVAYKPTYDAQKDIYKAIIEDLGAQMDVLQGASDLSFSTGDFLYQSNPANWVAFANTLRLRMALRSRDAFEAAGEGAFINGVITDALANPLIDESNEAVFHRAQEGLFLSDPNELMGGHEDVWFSFEYNQARWVLSDKVVNILQDNNDPRLEQIAMEPDSVPGVYVGLEPNLVAPPKYGYVSKPTGLLRGEEKNDPVPAYIITAAESYFLQAEAALLGFAGDAESLYQSGIKAHMSYAGVDGADADNFITTEPIASLSGSTDENLEKVWRQRWLALLNNGYEAWALVRRTNLIPDQVGAQYLSNITDGSVPSRLVYPTSELTLNADNVAAANGGKPDLMTTSVWWDVD